MKVAEVMSQKVMTVGPGTPFKEVAEILLSHDISGVPVVDDQERLVGIVTEADLLSKEAYPGRNRRRLLEFFADVISGREAGWVEKASGKTAGDVMTKRVLSVDPDEDVHKVARLMLEYEVKRFPVVQDGTLVGIVSRHDLLRFFHRTDENLKAGIESLLKRCLYVPPDHVITVSVAEGVVTLEGTVQYESDIHAACNIASALDAVVGVEDRLTYREADPESPES